MRCAGGLWSNVYTFGIDCMLRIECKAIQDAEFYPLPIVHRRRLHGDLEPLSTCLNASK